MLPDYPHTGHVARILRNAGHIADELGHFQIGTEHILIAMAEDENCIAKTMLGDSAKYMRKRCSRILGKTY